MNLFFRTLLFVLILSTGIAALAIYWTFYRPLPDYSATIELPGIEQPVDIHWDSFGVPHIYAEQEQDLYYAIGYVHAQERLWQMTLSQLVAEGRFAEFLGETLVPMDRYQRTLGFWETAERIREETSDEILQILDAYARGVNDYAEQNRRNLPVEFTLLDMEPIPWTPTHSLAVARLMAWEMNVSWWSKVTFGYLAETLPEATLQELYPEYEPDGPIMMESFEPGAWSRLIPLLDKEFDVREISQRIGTAVGSNAWVVSGDRTESGFPMLAGDPHMGLNIPGHWFEMHLSKDGQNLSGATIPGAPVIVLGQNEHHAWSLTNMMADDTDFFLEQLHPDDPDRYLADTLGGEQVWNSIEIRDEVIRVSDADDQLYQIRSSERGPIISDIYPVQEMIGDRLISMKWAGHLVSHEIEALYQINWARSMDQFMDGLEKFHSPGQNVAYADREGNIAMISAARLPIRLEEPILFREGWNPNHRWQGWIPFNELPRVINPASGHAANANNKLHGDDYPYYISAFWEPSSRIERIETYLAEYDTLDTDIFRRMQMDSYSVHARELVEQILPILRSSESRDIFSDILPYLENWDFRYDPTSTAASVLDAFFLNLTRNTLADELGETAYQNLIRVHSVPTRIMNRLIREDSFLFNDESTPEIESREQIIVQSMHDALDWLREQYGDTPINWRWENVHTLTLKPPLFAEASEDEGAPRALRLIVNNLMSKGPYPAPGHAMSINNGQYRWTQPFDMTQGASIRRIVDLSEPHRSQTVLPTGQSGNPISQFYGDQTDLWLNGQYRYLYQDSTFFREVSYQTMRLIPK